MTRDEQKHLREAKKQLGLAIKNDTKECGFQKINGLVYKFINDFLYECLISISPIDLGKKLSIRLSFKPIVLDELFRDIFEIKTGKAQSPSFHVQGALVAPAVGIEEWTVPIESIDDMHIVYRNTLNQVDSVIKSHHDKINDIIQFRNYVSEQKNQKLNFILSEIFLGNYQNAFSVVEQEISQGNSGGFLDSNGKSIFIYVKSYCEYCLVRCQQQ
jgi:hypothetical protein